MAGFCVDSRCGDGHVDERPGESCDDANAVDGDGCSACVWDCSSDAACDDGRACNGEETCDLRIRMCTSGAPPPDGSTCRGGAGSCLDGVCLLSACEDDVDCSDGNPCNGPELCTAEGCALGVALDCDDGDPCTADRCVEDVGCGYDPIDRDGDGHAPASLGACGDDCNDGRRDTHPGAVELCDGADNDCDGRIDEGSAPRFYADCDGDGHAAEGALSIVSCRVPSGALSGCPGGGAWTTLAPEAGADCNDGNALVHPSQTTYQSEAIPGAPAGSAYDYDCDGIETELFPVELGGCMSMRDVCATTHGWIGERAECGESGLMLSHCRAFLGPSGLLECVGIPDTTLRTQRCL
jgi:cysteine-rich repeat protein